MKYRPSKEQKAAAHKRRVIRAVARAQVITARDAERHAEWERNELARLMAAARPDGSVMEAAFARAADPFLTMQDVLENQH